MLTDGRGVPLATVLSGANRPDMKQLGALLDARLIPAPEIARHRCVDRGYDYDPGRATAAARG